MSGYFTRRAEERARRDAENRRLVIEWTARRAEETAQRAQHVPTEEERLKEQQRQDFWLGVRIGVGVLAGVAVAKTINGAAAAPDGWALATWANQNRVQL